MQRFFITIVQEINKICLSHSNLASKFFYVIFTSFYISSFNSSINTSQCPAQSNLSSTQVKLNQALFSSFNTVPSLVVKELKLIIQRWALNIQLIASLATIFVWVVMRQLRGKLFQHSKSVWSINWQLMTLAKCYQLLGHSNITTNPTQPQRNANLYCSWVGHWTPA